MNIIRRWQVWKFAWNRIVFRKREILHEGGFLKKKKEVNYRIKCLRVSGNKQTTILCELLWRMSTVCETEWEKEWHMWMWKDNSVWTRYYSCMRENDWEWKSAICLWTRHNAWLQKEKCLLHIHVSSHTVMVWVWVCVRGNSVVVYSTYKRAS